MNKLQKVKNEVSEKSRWPIVPKKTVHRILDKHYPQRKSKAWSYYICTTDWDLLVSISKSKIKALTTFCSMHNINIEVWSRTYNSVKAKKKSHLSF